jgi:hypothetical protein
MQLPVTVQTNLRDASDPNDDGKRTFYVKGEMKKAIGMALRAAGAKMAIGGTLTVTYVGDEPTKGFPKKIYTATYAPPAPGAAFFEEQAAPQQQPQQVAYPPQQPQQYSPPVMQAAPPVQAAPGAGMVQLTPEQYAAMQAAMAQQAPPAAAQPAESQKAPYSQYAEAMGFAQPTDKAPF